MKIYLLENSRYLKTLSKILCFFACFYKSKDYNYKAIKRLQITKLIISNIKFLLLAPDLMQIRFGVFYVFYSISKGSFFFGDG